MGPAQANDTMAFSARSGTNPLFDPRLLILVDAVPPRGPSEQPQPRTKFYTAVLPEREAIAKSMGKPVTVHIGARHIVFKDVLCGLIDTLAKATSCRWVRLANPRAGGTDP